MQGQTAQGDADGFGSEQPLRAFLSSSSASQHDRAMRKHLKEAIERIPGFRVWAFENAPPSPRGLVESYQEPAAAADLLIYVATDRITDPIRGEVEAALNNNVPVFVLDMRTPDADPATTAYLEHLRTDRKFVAADDLSHAAAVLTAAIVDESTRRWREARVPSGDFVLQQLLDSSNGRIRAVLDAIGVPEQIATSIVADESIGDRLIGTRARPVTVALGGIGVGKSLFLERRYRAALAQFRADRTAPLPVFIRAKELVGASLRDLVLERAGTLGFPWGHGLFIAIDGLDEPGADRVEDLLMQTRELTSAIRQTTVLATSRPVASATIHRDEALWFNPLLPDEALRLIERVSGRPNLYREWSTKNFYATLSETLRYPLFALITGVLMREGGQPYLEPTALLQALTERALRSSPHASTQLLRRLAVAQLDNDTIAVESAMLGGAAATEELAGTRLVQRTPDGRLAFALPALVDWFGSEAIAFGDDQTHMDVNVILANPEKLAQWRYPLSIAIVKARNERSAELLEQLVVRQTPYAATVIVEGLEQYARVTRPETAIPLKSVENALKRAQDVITDALGPMVAFVPWRSGGAVTVRGGGSSLQATDAQVEIAWYGPNDVRQPSSRVGSAFVPFVNDKPAWAWHFTINEVRKGITTAVRRQSFHLEQRGQPDERLWKAIANFSDFRHDGAVSIKGVMDDVMRAKAGSALPSRIEPESGLDASPTSAYVLRRITEIRDANPDAEPPEWIPQPYALPDVLNPIQRAMSRDRFRELLIPHAAKVYRNALRIYRALVEQWLWPLRKGMALYAQLPIRVAIEITRYDFDEQGLYRIAGRTTFTPLETREGDDAVYVTAVRQSTSRSTARSLRTETPLRPVEDEDLQLGTRTPATNLAYTWIERELRALSWIADTPATVVDAPRRDYPDEAGGTRS